MNEAINMKKHQRKRTAWILLFLSCIILTILKLRIDAGSWTIHTISKPSLWLAGVCWIGNIFVSIFLLLLLALKSRIIAYLVAPLIILCWVITLYIHYSYGYVDFSEQVTALLATDWKELSSVVDFYAILVFFSACTILVMGMHFIVKHCSCLLKSIKSIYLFFFFIVYVSVTTAVVTVSKHYCPEKLLPFIFGPTAYYYSDTAKENAISTINNPTCPAYVNRILIPFYRQIFFFYHVHAWHNPKQLIKSEEIPYILNERMGSNVTVVLVIGESYRSDHASWNGYHRMTLPQLSAHKNHIINFPYFASYATSTASSIYGILTDATCSSREAKHTSFLGLMKKAGYTSHLLLCRTTYWVNVPDIFTALDNKLDSIDTLLNSSEIEKKVNEIAKRPGKKIILIEDGTGHAPYDHEPQFDCFGSAQIDRYDNALLQTDDLLNRLVTALSPHESVMLYASDHGQSFGEDGIYMHGGALNRTEQRHVFAFLWASSQYAAKHQNMLNNVRTNSQKYLSHDDIYFSILSLGGIDCSIQEAKLLNLTLPQENRISEQKFQLKN